MRFTLKTGDLAYLDTLCAGLVPCKVLSITRRQGDPSYAHSHASVRARVTAARHGYERGEEVTVPFASCVPRAAVLRRKYSTRIRQYLTIPD